MKRILKNIILSSLLSLGLYLLFAITLFGWLEDQKLRFLMCSLAAVTTFAAIFFYIQKYRKGVCEYEVLSDYKNEKYDTKREMLLIWQREKLFVFAVFMITLICSIISLTDRLLFQTQVLSLLTTILFGSLMMLSSVIEIPFLGNFLSGFYVCALYLLFVFLYRKKRYTYWMKK